MPELKSSDKREKKKNETRQELKELGSVFSGLSEFNTEKRQK